MHNAYGCGGGGRGGALARLLTAWGGRLSLVELAAFVSPPPHPSAGGRRSSSGVGWGPRLSWTGVVGAAAGGCAARTSNKKEKAKIKHLSSSDIVLVNNYT